MCREGETGKGFLGPEFVITSHVLFAFKNDECVSSMWFPLLVALFVRVSVLDNTDLQELVTWKMASAADCQETHALNRSKAVELALQVLLVGFVAQTRHDQRLVRVAADVGIFVGVI